MSDPPGYIHPNDRSNPDCLWPIEPGDAKERRSPVEDALDSFGIFYNRLNSSWLTVENGLHVSLWPSREGTYLAAIGVQYAERRHEGYHASSIEKLMYHPLLRERRRFNRGA